MANLNALDNDEVKQNLIQFLQDQDKFSNYNFEGSSVSILLDLLSHTIKYAGHYAHMLNNESNVDSAYQKSSLQSKAKFMNYLPGSVKSSSAIVTFHIPVTGATVPAGLEFVLPRGSTIQSNTVNADNRNFILVDDVHINDSSLVNGVYDYTSAHIEIFEGTFETVRHLVDNTLVNQRFVIDDKSIDTDTIRIRVFENSSVNEFVTYNVAEDYMNINGSSRAFFLTTEESGLYEVQFGNDIYGKSLSTGNKVEISYISTSGEFGNNSKNFQYGETFILDAVQYSVLCDTIAKSSGGTEEESTEELRFNIPNHHRRQNRAVIVDDFKSLLLSRYRNIQSINVWGGEENNPPRYGEVFVSINPKTGRRLSSKVKKYLTSILAEKAVKALININIIDPVFIDINLVANVTYSPLDTTRQPGELKSHVKNTISNFNNTILNKFGSLFSSAVLNNLIIGSDKAIISSYCNLKVQKRVIMDKVNLQTYNVVLFNQLIPKTVKSDVFTFRLRKSWLADDGAGRLQVWYNDVDTGLPTVYKNEYFGTVDYITGDLVIQNLLPVAIESQEDYITLEAAPDVPDFASVRNNIININTIKANLIEDYTNHGEI